MMRMPAHGVHLRDIGWKFPRFSRRVSVGELRLWHHVLVPAMDATYGERFRNTVQLGTLLKKNLVWVFRNGDKALMAATILY
jgi:hypothetical protein